MKLVLSTLPKTWLFDLDGLLVAHNGHLGEGDRLLPGVQEFWQQLGQKDRIVLLTARTAAEAAAARDFLVRAGLRVDQILADCPLGERILLNDAKPSGLCTAHAVCLPRDAGLAGLSVILDPEL